jgi:hypothetical protein
MISPARNGSAMKTGNLLPIPASARVYPSARLTGDDKIVTKVQRMENANMRALFEKLPRLTMILGLATVLITPQFAYSDVSEEEPSAMAMTGDLLIARPMLLVATLVGTAVYVVSLPFSLAGGNEKSTRETLIYGPAEATFVRCLGCTKPGRQ